MSLFGRNTHYHSHEIKTEIVEKRAVTDDSIKLLNGMQEKARENILCFGKAKLEGMSGEFEYYTATLPEKMFAVQIGVRIILNGKELIDRVEILPYEIPKDVGGKLDIIYSMVSNLIAKELLFKSDVLADIQNGWK